MFFRRQDITRMVGAASQRLQRLGIANHPAMLIAPYLEGYKGYTYGIKTGPSLSTENMFHELGHAAEFGPDTFAKRCVDGTFVFHFSQSEYMEYRTDAATQREVRTFARQWHLMRLAGYKSNRDEYAAYYAHVLRFMPDWYEVAGEGEEGREASCKAGILRCIEEYDARETLARVVGWLDKTQQRFKRRKIKPIDYLAGFLQLSNTAIYDGMGNAIANA